MICHGLFCIHWAKMRGDCLFAYIGRIDDHHCLISLLIMVDSKSNQDNMNPSTHKSQLNKKVVWVVEGVAVVVSSDHMPNTTSMCSCPNTTCPQVQGWGNNEIFFLSREKHLKKKVTCPYKILCALVFFLNVFWCYELISIIWLWFQIRFLEIDQPETRTAYGGHVC